MDKHNLLEYMNEAKDILEFIAWLTKLSNIHGTMKSTLLGVSSYQNGLRYSVRYKSQEHGSLHKFYPSDYTV